jgi:hypothetical protein
VFGIAKEWQTKRTRRLAVVSRGERVVLVEYSKDKEIREMVVKSLLMCGFVKMFVKSILASSLTKSAFSGIPTYKAKLL